MMATKIFAKDSETNKAEPADPLLGPTAGVCNLGDDAPPYVQPRLDHWTQPEDQSSHYIGNR